MKLPVSPSILIASVLALGAAGWIYSGQLEDDPFASDVDVVEDAPDQAQTAASVIPTVRVAESFATPHRAILVYTGRTEADRRATLRAETDGRIVEVAAEESARVEEDALIIRIAASDRFAILKQAEALLKQRQIENEAAQKLAGKGYQTETSRAQAEANLSSARASLEQIRIDIARLTLEAPFSGILESRAVEVGDYVQAGDEIGVLAEFDPIVVAIQVAEKEIARVEEGVVAEIELISGDALTGVVSRIATRADPNTRTFEVELEIANADASLLDGMTAKVRLPAQQLMAHEISPALLTLSDAGEVGVKSVDADNRVIFHPIEIIEDTSTSMWVAGLPRKLTLITVGHAFVAPGALVEPVEADSLKQDEQSAAPGISSSDSSEDRS